MGAIVLDNAEINPYTLVAAGAVVRNGARFPGGVLVAGVPAKIVRDLTPEERTMIDESALHYVGTARAYREQ
jgi:carbonic anhydrase/acetyltransferase-like protein (isoleucine patch superfamily)